MPNDSSSVAPATKPVKPKRKKVAAPSAYSEKLKDPRWQRKRLEVMQRDNFTCCDCNASDKELHVHHCFYSKGDPWETRETLLMTLCWQCHEVRQKHENAAKYALGILFKECPVNVLAEIDPWLMRCAFTAFCDKREHGKSRFWRYLIHIQGAFKPNFLE